MRISFSNWNGKHSARVQIKLGRGSLWFGGALRKTYQGAWIIYNGSPFSWQIAHSHAQWGRAPRTKRSLQLNPNSPFWLYLAQQKILLEG